MSGTITQALRGSGGNDPPLMSRVLGVMLLCGGALGLISLAVSGAAVEKTGMGIVGSMALAVGVASIIWAEHARVWTVHATFAAGTGAVCLGIYFTETATGVYAVLFVWLVVIAASFFSARAIAAHVAWIMLASGVALSSSATLTGVSPLTRWAFGSVLLVTAAVVMSQIVAGRRATEERLRKEIAEKEQLQRELEHLANHDPLTGLPNRRWLEREIDRELARADRLEMPLCAVALDLDEFKAFNDAHGHAAGDHLLKQSASIWSQALRSGDLIARMGGDEFVALLPGSAADEAARVVRRLRDGYPRARSFSAGIACWDRRESAEELLGRADAAMYAAKGVGRGAETPAQ
jgi:diguanylate cyclase (GGDEF)-like protein